MLTENNWNLRGSISTLKKTFFNVVTQTASYLLNAVEKKKKMEKSSME